MPTVLVIAGSDSSGGAGITRDLQVLADHEVAACCAITAITAQTDRELVSVHHVPALSVQQQIRTALAARNVDVIKIGMLGSAATITAVVNALRAHPHIPLIVDPVLRSSSGGRLLDDSGLQRLREQLLPHAWLLTPNIPEAADLLKEAPATSVSEVIAQGRQLLSKGARAVLLKGGHASDAEATDVLLSDTGNIATFSAPRLQATLRGTGCALATAIAANIACGLALETACRQAKEYVRQRIERHQRGPK
jgi:hydroxymethylpyrimidine/phosphomethylpyrimidine kinase